MTSLFKNYFWLAFVGVMLTGCSKDGDVNLFSVKDDIEFGQQLQDEIYASPAEYPILDKTTHPAAYAYINSMMDAILSSDQIDYRDEFPWEVTIINDDVMNAFAAPGGKLFVYTGLIKYLDNGAQLAGVMAHEIAHADKRHSTEQMTKQYGLSVLFNIVLGKDASQLEKIAGELAKGASGLYFSREDEYEADEFSIKYLSDTRFYPKGIAGFFEKLKEEGFINQDGSNNSGKQFEFLSTHPSDANRLDNINEVYQSIGSPDGDLDEAAYSQLKSEL